MTKKVVKPPKVKIVKRIGRPMSLPPFWSDMARACGGVEELGKEIGKSVRQVRRIAHRESPLTATSRIALAAAAEKHGMLRAMQRWEDGAEA